MSDEFDTRRYDRRSGATPSVDGNRPRIARTNSLLFGYKPDGGSAPAVNRRGGGGTFGSTPNSPSTRPAASQSDSNELPWWYTTFFGSPDPLNLNEQPRAEGGRRNSGGSFAPPVPYGDALARTITSDRQTVIDGPPAEGNDSIYAPLGDLNPEAQFLFDRGAPIDPETGKRTGVLQSRGVYGSADTLDRALPEGTTTETGSNENIMTVAAGVQWLRNLAARDRTAYNELVVLLRNAGYPGLSANDAELPLNGYSQQVGTAFALAANDLANAGLGGDNRTLLEYLTDRGQGYADYLAQQEADQAYQPVERQYQDPATVAAAAKRAAAAALGRKLTDEEEARFEAAFRGKENAFYDQLDTARQNKTQFAAYSPDVAGQADEFIDGDQFDTERAAERIRQYGEAFLGLMGS